MPLLSLFAVFFRLFNSRFAYDIAQKKPPLYSQSHEEEARALVNMYSTMGAKTTYTGGMILSILNSFDS